MIPDSVVKEFTTLLFHPPNYAAPPSIPIIRTIIIGLSGNMDSNQLITASRQKDIWGFYDITINVFCNE